jgi:chromosome segregation ATPase
MEDKRRIIQDSEEIIELLTDTTKIDDEIRDLDDELFITLEFVSKLVNENSKTSDSIDNYNKKYEELSSRYDKLQAKREELLKQRNDRQGQALRMKAFTASLSESEDELSDWNERIWMLLVDGATVHIDTSITFKLKNGEELLVL